MLAYKTSGLRTSRRSHFVNKVGRTPGFLWTWCGGEDHRLLALVFILGPNIFNNIYFFCLCSCKNTGIVFCKQSSHSYLTSPPGKSSPVIMHIWTSEPFSLNSRQKPCCLSCVIFRPWHIWQQHIWTFKSCNVTFFPACPIWSVQLLFWSRWGHCSHDGSTSSLFITTVFFVSDIHYANQLVSYYMMRNTAFLSDIIGELTH